MESNSVEYYARAVTIPFVDHLLTEMSERSEALQRKASMACSLVPSIIRKDPSKINIDLEYFHDDLLNPAALHNELHMWKMDWTKQDLQDIPDDYKGTLKVCDRQEYTNISHILRIAATFTITSCECERSFSQLRHIKTYDRAPMTEDRLNGLTLMSSRPHNVN